MKFKYEEVDFNPRIKWKPKMCIRYSNPISRTVFTNFSFIKQNRAEMFKFIKDSKQWLNENYPSSDWLYEEATNRIWFKNKSDLLAFKLRWG